MEKKQVNIPGMSCNHCVMTVENEVKTIEGVKFAKADLATKQAVFEWDAPATWEQINAMLVEIEYPPQELITL